MNKNITKIAGYFFYLLLIWGLYRWQSGFPEYLDELVFKPLLWLLPIWYLVVKVEKQSLKSLGLVWHKPFKNALLGLGISLFIWFEYILVFIVKKADFNFNPQNISAGFWLLAFLVTLATGIVEEVAFRGFLMTRLNQVIKDKLLSNILTGLLFFLIHLPILVFVQNQNFLGIVQFFILSVSLGIIDGMIFWKTKGILAPIIAHSSLNFFSLLIG